MKRIETTRAGARGGLGREQLYALLVWDSYFSFRQRVGG